MDRIWTVEIDGRALPLAAAEYNTLQPGCFFDEPGCYWFGNFSLQEKKTQIRICSDLDLSHVRILPESVVESFRNLSDHELLLTLKASAVPIQFSVEDGSRDNALLLFGNLPEKDIPAADDGNLIFFGPGEHHPHCIELRSGQTLYLAENAVVHGFIHASGDNIRVCGRGIITQKEYSREDAEMVLLFENCNHLTLQDFTGVNSVKWNLVLKNCNDVIVENVKLCGSRTLNDDAIDICNSSNIVIRHCFLRAIDDIIAIKGLMDCQDAPCENIVVEHTRMWCDLANVFRIGYECSTEAMQHGVFRNLDILHYTPGIRVDHNEFWRNAVILLQACAGMPIKDLLFENIRIHSDGYQTLLLDAATCECSKWTGFGQIDGCILKDIRVYGTAGDFDGQICLDGGAADHSVRNITLKNISYFGSKIKADFPQKLYGFAEKAVIC